MPQSFKSIFKKENYNLLIYFLGQGFNLITPLLVVPYIVALCGVENYGKVSVGMAIVFFVIVIIDFGSDIIGVKDVATNRTNNQRLQKILETSFASRFLLLLGLLIILSVLFLTVPFFENEQKLFFFSLPILLGQLLNPIWFLQGLDNFKLIAFLNIVSKTIYLIGVFIFVKVPSDYIFVNLWWGIGMIVPFGITLIFYKQKLKISFTELKFIDIIDYLKNGYSFCISQIFLSFKNYSPVILISFLGGFNTAGFYKIIEQIIMLFRTYLQVVFRFFYPKLCLEIHENYNSGIAYWKKINGTNALIIISMLVLVFVFAPEMLTFFKVKLVDIGFLSLLLRFSLAVPFLTTISYALEQLLFSLDKKKIYIRITIFAVILNFVMMYFLFKNFELFGLISSLITTEIFVITIYSFLIFGILNIKNTKH